MSILRVKLEASGGWSKAGVGGVAPGLLLLVVVDFGEECLRPRPRPRPKANARTTTTVTTAMTKETKERLWITLAMVYWQRITAEPKWHNFDY